MPRLAWDTSLASCFWVRFPQPFAMIKPISGLSCPVPACTANPQPGRPRTGAHPLSPTPHPPQSLHTQPSAPGARALIPAKGAVCHGIPLPGLKACGLYVSSEVLQAIQQPGPERAVQGCMGCVRASACTEANPSSKSQCKTICDSHFFINAGSARWQPPSPPQTRHGFPAGAAAVPHALQCR